MNDVKQKQKPLLIKREEFAKKLPYHHKLVFVSIKTNSEDTFGAYSSALRLALDKKL